MCVQLVSAMVFLVSNFIGQSNFLELIRVGEILIRNRQLSLTATLRPSDGISEGKTAYRRTKIGVSRNRFWN